MRRISYAFDTPWANKDDADRGVIEVPDDATDEQIDAEVAELFYERYNYGWSDAEEGEE